MTQKKFVLVRGTESIINPLERSVLFLVRTSSRAPGRFYLRRKERHTACLGLFAPFHSLVLTLEFFF